MGDLQVAYWHAELADAAAVDVATDRPRRAGSVHRPAEVELPVEQAHWSAAETLAAVAVLLHRHTGHTDLVVGVRAGMLGATGGAAHTVLPLRLRFSADDTFRRLVETVSAVASRAVRAPAVPVSRAPLVRVVVGPYDALPVSGTAAEFEFSARDTAVRLRYDAGLFDRATAVWWLGHLAAVRRGARRQPHSPVGALPVQSQTGPAPAWGLAVLPGFVPADPPGAEESLTDRFGAVVARYGDLPAVTGPSGSYTYAALDGVTARLAHRLRAAASGGGRIALLMEHDCDVVAGIWGVLRAGAAYVPLDPGQPDGRHARVVANADVGAIVCDAALRGRATKLARGRPVVDLESLGDGSPDGPVPGGRADDLAYLLYTSGSTGAPKGVMQSHGGALAHALTYADRVRLGPGERVPLLARTTFDASVMDLFGALLSGAALHVVDPLGPADVVRGRLAQAAPSVLHCTPTLFRHLLGDVPEAARVDELRTVRVVVLGGEEAGPHDVRRFRSAFAPTAALVNGLGPTECTVALQHLAVADDEARPVLPVGWPVPGVEVGLLDAAGNPTEVFGEIAITGDRVAMGYWKQPAASEAAFGVDSDGRRVYRTGDMARRRADGSLVFCGRRDRQIKIRGFRVEPGEVEATLRAHPTVAQAALTVDDRGAAPRLVAFATPATAFRPDPEELQRYLNRLLPDYARPWRIVVLDDLPLGPTGKVDRARLPLPSAVATLVQHEATTEVQRVLLRLWCETLDVPSAGIHTNFMVSGGDSIRMLRLLTLVKDELDVDVPLLDFLGSPTIATLATFVERSSDARPSR